MDWNRSDNGDLPSDPTDGDLSGRTYDFVIVFMLGCIVGVALTNLVELLR